MTATAIYSSCGDRSTEDETGVKLGKAWLVSRLQALLQTESLHLLDTSETRALAKELLDYEISVDENANDKYGAFKVGTHDDLVTALGLVVQGEKSYAVMCWARTHKWRARGLQNNTAGGAPEVVYTLSNATVPAADRPHVMAV